MVSMQASTWLGVLRGELVCETLPGWTLAGTRGGLRPGRIPWRVHRSTVRPVRAWPRWSSVRDNYAIRHDSSHQVVDLRGHAVLDKLGANQVGQTDLT